MKKIIVFLIVGGTETLTKNEKINLQIYTYERLNHTIPHLFTLRQQKFKL